MCRCKKCSKCVRSLVHDIDCQGKCCENIPRINRSENMLKSYENLTSPESMANQENPLSHAFKLTREIANQKRKNIQVKNELDVFYRKSRKFTVDMLDVCENNKEVAVLLNFEEDDLSQKIKILMEAIVAKHKQFIAHRHVQQLLHTIVQPSWPWPGMEFLPGILQYVLYILAFPILAIVFLLRKDCDILWLQKMSHFMATPFGKFVSHTSHYCAFVVLLFISSAREYHEPSVIEYLLSAIVWSMCIQQALIFWKERCCWRCCCYLHSRWNQVLALMLIGFVTSDSLWLIGTTAVGGWPVEKLESAQDVAGHRILLLANSFFSISTILSVFYLGSFWTVNSESGPLQISTLRMVKDIRRFLMIFIGVFLAFSLGVRNIYSYRNQLEATYANGNGTTQTVDDELSTFSESWQVMFWALFDQTNVEKFETSHPRFRITTNTGKLMFATYLIIVVLIGVNMLIAMMNNSYEYVANDKEGLNWKTDRTALWLEFAHKDDYILPPPYNILQILIYFRDRFKSVPKKTEIDLESVELDCIEDSENKQENRKRILQEIVERYLENETKTRLQEEAERTLLEQYLKLKERQQEIHYESNV